MKLRVFSIFLLLSLVCIVQMSLADETALSATTQAGQTAAYTVELRNDSAVSHDYRLMLAGLPEDMAVTFTQAGPVLESITIPAGMYGQITLTIRVPPDTALGRYTAVLSAIRDDSAILTLPITLHVENTYAVHIVSQNVNINTFSGQEFTFEAVAANSGAAPITNLRLGVNAPARWIVRVDPSSVTQLEPSGEVKYTVWVLVPATEPAVEEKLTLTINSDQTTSPDASLRVRVQTSPNIFLFAGIISVVAIAGVFIYFRVKGRR
jgi:uncharacterized membrane protein